MADNYLSVTTYSFEVHSQSVQDSTISNTEHKLL